MTPQEIIDADGDYIVTAGYVPRSAEYERWAAWARNARKTLAAIADRPGPRPNRFYLEVPELGTFGARRTGGLFHYADARDLTAAVLSWWLDRSGTPGSFFLGDAIAALGPLWDGAACDLVWPHLSGSAKP